MSWFSVVSKEFGLVGVDMVRMHALINLENRKI
jgi:hypothetical protein